MTPCQIIRLRDALRDGILIRRGEVIDEALALERANNLVSYVENVLEETAEQHAERVIK